MSIKAELQRAVRNEELFCVEPFPGDTPERSLLVSPELMGMIENAANDSRLGRLRADFEDFVAGGQVVLSFDHYGHKNATMGLLDPPHEGTWEFRSRDPKPGLRIFGRFAEIDTFIALDWAPRSKPLVGFDKKPLGDGASLEFQLAQIEVDQQWAKILPGVAPVIGSECSDYFTAKCSVN